MYITSISIILFVIVLLRYIFVEIYPNVLSPKVKQNLNNFSALSYGVIWASSITGIIIVNLYKCCLGKYKYIKTLEHLKFLDLLIHVMPLLFINKIAPKSDEITIDKIYIYHFFIGIASIYICIFDLNKLYPNIPQNFLCWTPTIISMVSSYWKYPM